MNTLWGPCTFLTKTIYTDKHKLHSSPDMADEVAAQVHLGRDWMFRGHSMWLLFSNSKYHLVRADGGMVRSPKRIIDINLPIKLAIIILCSSEVSSCYQGALKDKDSASSPCHKPKGKPSCHIYR